MGRRLRFQHTFSIAQCPATRGVTGDCCCNIAISLIDRSISKTLLFRSTGALAQSPSPRVNPRSTARFSPRRKTGFAPPAWEFLAKFCSPDVLAYRSGGLAFDSWAL